MRHTHRYHPEHDHEQTIGGVELAPGFFDHAHTTAGTVTHFGPLAACGRTDAHGAHGLDRGKICVGNIGPMFTEQR
jgi:hypothetical protein